LLGAARHVEVVADIFPTQKGSAMAETASAEAPLRIACIQMEPHVGDKAGNLAKSEAMIRAAAGQGARLLVLPELCNSGYVFKSRAEAFELSEPVPGGESCDIWRRLGHELGVTLVAGICERDGSALYNSAVVIGPEGHIGTFRKVHLWNEEALYFEPGNLGFPVFTTPVGRIGALVCYDGWFPESSRACALAGADILCVPTNWVPIPGQDPKREAMANILLMAAAHMNAIFIAAADRVGTERGQPFIGQSLVVSYSGWPIGGPASPDKEEIVYADVNLADARRSRSWNQFNHILRDRRPDAYAASGVQPRAAAETAARSTR
jgi:predicted amidohydrolase